MLKNVLLLALREIRRNVMRSFLTILGIVIGVAAVITMVTLGSGATARVTAQIQSLGSNMLMIRPGQRRGPGGGSMDAKPFDAADAEAIAREIPALNGVAPSASRPVTAVYGNENWSTSVTGTDNEYFAVRDWTLDSGRIFTPSELRSGKASCVLGQTVRRELFGATDPLGQRIRLTGGVSCEVIGTLRAKGQSGMGNDQDDTIIMPLRAFQRRIAGNPNVQLIQVSVAKGNSTAATQRSIESLLRERRHISAGQPEDFTVMDMAEIAQTVAGTTRILTALLGSVAAVSLLVGGIGIMNIMLVSVTERTREIGVRLAIGALERDVMIQFLVEAVVLACLGGVFGILLALGLSMALARVIDVPFVFQPGVVVLAFAFSAGVGVAFGFLPARRAARLDPIEALRHE